MTATAYAPHPGYAVVPSPHPWQAAHDLTLIALHTAIRFSGLFAKLCIIGIRVSVKGNGLLIEVWDSDPTPPQGSYLDNHLSTVADISQQWNCYQPRDSGKVIWAELAIPQQRQTGELGFGLAASRIERSRTGVRA